jgi:hypothetical protein
MKRCGGPKRKKARVEYSAVQGEYPLLEFCSPLGWALLYIVEESGIQKLRNERKSIL